MKWMRERDALIAQTLAFVQSVTGRKDGLGPLDPLLPDLPAAPPDIAPPPADLGRPPEMPAVATPPAPRPLVPGDFQRELKGRIASFRAHQERFNRERDEYFNATLARLRAAIKDGTKPERRS